MAKPTLRDLNERAQKVLDGETARKGSGPTPITSKTPGVPGHLQLPADSERRVKRYVAVCPIMVYTSQDSPSEPCPYNERDKKSRKTHATKDGAEVETGKHIREAHADELRAEVTVLRKRAIVSEEIVEG